MTKLCAVLGVVAAAAWAGPRTVIVASGDCRDAALLTQVRDFRDVAARTLGADLLEADVVLDLVRPRAARSLQDIERQVESARALLYSGQNERGLEVVARALVDLERVSPEARPWPVTQAALVLQALLNKNLERKAEMSEAFRRVARIDPAFQLDPDAHPPSALAALEAVKKELGRARRVTLQVRVEAGPAATVFLDGMAVGATPFKLDLPPGTYRVQLVGADGVSFPHRVELPRDARLSVDMEFEGGLSQQPPLCLRGADDALALKLAALATAERVIVVRNTASRGNPPLLAGTSYDVTTGTRGPSGTSQPELLADLVNFVLTGRETVGITPKSAPAPAPRLASPGLAPTEPVVTAPQVAPPPAEVTTSGGSRWPAPRIVSVALIGVGGALAALGGVVWGGGFANRSRLLGLTDEAGRLPTPGTTAHGEALALMGATDTNLAVSLALAGAGIGAAVGGLLGVLLFAPPPDAPPALSLGVTVTPAGAVGTLSGSF